MAALRSCSSAATSGIGSSWSLLVPARAGTTVPGMSTKRQPSKQRRQTQNRNNRAALEKRRQNVETGKAPAGKVGGDTKTSSTSSSAKSSGSFLSRLTGPATDSKGQQLPTGYRA